jgi:uncharacterized membrane protein YGL010W
MHSLWRSTPELMVQYAHYHRDRRNILTHLLGIPLIFTAIGVWLAQPQWSVAGLLLTPAWLAWGLSSLWYLSRGVPLLGWATSVANGGLIALAHALLPWAQDHGLSGLQTGGLLFVTGWVLQFVGHFFEGRKPAFVDDLVGLLTGPMFVVAEVLMVLGALGALHREVTAQAGPTRWGSGPQASREIS